MIHFLQGRGLWVPSRYAEFPQVPIDCPESTQQLFVLVGGLALILSRQSEVRLRNDFAASLELYLLLKKDLKKYGRTSATARMLSAAGVELTPHADPATRTALRQCLAARIQYDAAMRQGGQAPALRPDPNSSRFYEAADSQPAGPEHGAATVMSRPAPLEPRTQPAAATGFALNDHAGSNPLALRLLDAVFEARKRRQQQAGPKA